MVGRFLELTTTPAVREARRRWEGADRYPGAGPGVADTLGPAEMAFLAAADGVYLASVGESGWPYVQFRGGPRGFLWVLDERTLGFADLRGNRQLLTVGNTSRDDRVALIRVDYRRRRRLKLLGRLAVVEDAALLRALTPEGAGVAERAVLIGVEALDWNCPQHIPVRVDLDEVAALQARVGELEAEVRRLRGG